MSDFIDKIKTRRSIRKFTQQPVPTEFILNILETASFAPSAHNAQPWRFLVLTEISAKQHLAKTMSKVWLQDLERDGVLTENRLAMAQESAERFTRAPVLVIACLTMGDMFQFSDEDRRICERDLGVQSLAAAIQTLLLAAHANELGACWYCAPMFCKTAVRQALKIPDGVEPQALITLGYPDETPKTPQRNPLKDSVYLNSWGTPLSTNLLH